MNPITYAINRITRKIPKPILNAVFIRQKERWRGTPPSLEDEIRRQVVDSRVLMDCDLVGGTDVYIPLQGVPYERIDNFEVVYRIPKNLTQGRSILSALSICFTDPQLVTSYGTGTNWTNSATMQAGQAMMDSHGMIPINSTHRVQVIGENVVSLRDNVIMPYNVFLRCIISNSSQMSHIQQRSYPAFTKLVELAVKSHIYNEYIIQMDMAELYAGQTLGKFKDEIDKYADSEELYTEYLMTVWSKIELMNDNESYQRYIKLPFGGYR